MASSAVAERQVEQDLPVPQVSNATTLLQAITRAASDPSVDIDKMERLWTMHGQMVMREAETAFNDAMTACQKEMRSIATDAENQQTHSRYATYARLDRALRPIYTSYDFSISYNTADSTKPEHIRVLAYVSRGVFTRTYQVDMPTDGKGPKGNDVMSKTHAAGAAMSYGQRYLLKGIFNVRIGEEDKDGNDAGKPGLHAVEFAKFKKAIEATTTKDKAKEKWQEGVQACQKLDDLASAENLKAVLLAHCKFIDEAAKAK